MAELYCYFSKDWGNLDFSDSAQVELFNHESYGTGVSSNNGFALGKKYLNVQVAMWKEDMKKGLLFKQELYDDQNFPKWLLDSIFKV